MRKSNFTNVDKPILVDTNGLKALTQSGRENAIRIGTLANARVQIGRSVRWNVQKVENYINSIK